jgi:proliferating cell nuclear antigen PCNA
MTIIFRAKSQEAYVIKVLAELLSNNIKTGCFVIDESGIFLCMMDHQKTILIDLLLKSENFTLYHYSHSSSKIYVGINLNHFHKMLRSIKKKDSIELFIDDSNINDLGIKVIPKEHNRISTSFIKIQNVQNLDIVIPNGYSSKTLNISSSEFQKMIKDFGNIGTTVKVISKNYVIDFSINAGGILKRSVKFGEESDSTNNVTTNSEEYSQDFLTEQLCRITKLSGLSSTMQIYTGKPLLFRSNIGNLGKISIYIKSKEQIELENYNTNIESDYSDD